MRKHVTEWVRLVCVGLVVLAAGVLVAEDSAALVMRQKLAERAIRGDFAAVLSVLQDRADASDPAIASLIHDLARHQRHTADADAARRRAYEESLAKVIEQSKAGRVEDALIAAIESHDLADAPDRLLKEPAVQAVAAEALRLAQAAEEGGDWVTALNLYRELDLLYEAQRTYREDAQRAASHVRVLQLYVPDRLQALYRAYAEARGDEDPLQVEPEAWQERLGSVQLPMLRQALAQAARRHVSTHGYLPLMRGAVRSLSIVLHTDALADQFPGFADADAMTRLRDYLDRLTAQFSEPDKTLNYLDTWEILDGILKMNRETVRLPESVVVYELAEGATGTLDDFSAIIWPHDLAEFSRSTQGKFTGVGIQIRRDTRLIVVSPLPNTPAQRAGIKAGDIIATVDGVATDAWSLDRAVNQITGEEGTTVTLGIQRPGQESLLLVPIRREEIPIESILGWQRVGSDRWDYWIDRDAGIGYVRLTQFLPQSASDLDAAVAQMQAEGPALRGLILDLRFNPGGLLTSAVDIADRFIAEGTIVSTVTADGLVNDESRATRRHTYPHVPLVVLVNQGSASASEIVAGALQDYRRADIVGTRSFGKGSVQDLFPLEHGEAVLKLTTQYYRLPGGRIIHRKEEARTWGIEPDLVVKMPDRQVADALQLRLDADILRDSQPPESPESPDTPDTPDTPESLEVAESSQAVAAVEPASPPVAGDLIDKGVDLQLESALLLLKTQLIAGDPALARGQ